MVVVIEYSGDSCSRTPGSVGVAEHYHVAEVLASSQVVIPRTSQNTAGLGAVSQATRLVGGA